MKTASGCLDELDERPAIQNSFIVRRLREALEFVRRKNSADALDEHLRHLEELEAVRGNAAYSMVRIIIWAIPILGLLGTVIGITIAVANLNPETLEESMTKVTHGLGVAFDHTATALSLTMMLMFVKSGVERMEDRLLARVDERVARSWSGGFNKRTPAEDPNDVSHAPDVGTGCRRDRVAGRAAGGDLEVDGRQYARAVA